MGILLTDQIADTVRDLCVEAATVLPPDVVRAIRVERTNETHPPAREIMQALSDNIFAGIDLGLPVCQDTGMAVVMIDLGQEVCLIGEPLSDAVNRGVAAGYTKGYLRCSMVADPLRRTNTGDNTPASLHVRLVPGTACRITVAPKGFGSENMSRIYMLRPTDDRETVIERICETVRIAGGNACPPVVLGVGLGGDFALAPLLAKRALLRPIGQRSKDPFYAALEKDALDAVNALGIGPMGMGGDVTALHIAIEPHPTHIAGLPLAINVSCHAHRHAERVLETAPAP